MSRIVVCRHGNTFDKGDIITRVGARTDLPLSSSGQIQSQALSRHFSPESSDYNFDVAYCSPLQRTRQTALAILGQGHKATQVEALEFLTEVDYGPDENKPESDVIDRLGKAALEAWDEKCIVPKGWKIKPDEIIRNWRDFMEAQSDNDSDVLIVTSNGVARFLFDAFHVNKAGLDIKLKTGAYGVVLKTKVGVNISCWNKRPD